ncbi:MAG TPA: efflux RND transporter periplasmic adaptor subunit [Candidatus Binataceae bacterium]|nr:efflux RND transporter periplasmic adaptor subunit [Candidatus Binataceae bacterium]
MFSRGWKKRAVWIAIAALVGLGGYAYQQSSHSDRARYVTAPVDRGSIVHAVTATGTVNPVTVVQVGTYVSGPITSIYADFNTPVKAGQLLAKIDPRPFAAQVALSRAALQNARAQLQKDLANLAYQKLTYRRDQRLLNSAVISHDQLDSQYNVYNQAVAQVALDGAAIQQQQANLRSAELNLNYTNIVSPVDGTVVSRNVDRGQTVAASYQTPTLFLVAQDLTKMQVDTNVSESDIGDVRIGQPVDFTVDAYTTKDFKGNVAQVRKAPITVQNVVTYDVVVSVPNPELLLMPGMTANISIITARRDNVLRVPERALAFSPHHAFSSPSGTGQGWGRSRVWVETAGKLHPARITRGLDDGNYVEVVSGALRPGDLVAEDSIRPDTERTTPGVSHRLHFPHL